MLRRLLIIAFVAATFALSAGSARAATRTWDGGGVDNNWTTDANWSSDTEPGALDTALFNGTSTKNCTINTDISITNLTINSGYTGTISPSDARRDFEIAGNISFGSGATGTLQFNKSTNTNKLYVTVHGNVTLTGGTLSLSGGAPGSSASGQMYHTDIMVYGTFTINGGTLDWVDTSGTAALYVEGAFTRSSGTFELPDRLIVGGNFTNTGTITHAGGTAGAAGSNGSGQHLVLLSPSSRTHSFGGATVRTTHVSDGLWSYHRWNSGAGTIAVDGSTIENAGIGLTLYAQTAAVTTGTTGPTLTHSNEGALTFGSGAYLRSAESTVATPDVPYFIVKDDRWSASAWIKTLAPDTSGAGIVSVQGDWGMRLDSSGRLQAFKRDTAPTTAPDTCTSTQDITDDTWHHVAVTNDGTSVKVYVDGELHNTCTSPGAQLLNGEGVYVGIGLDSANTAVNTATNFTGSMDELRLYNRALTAAEVYALAAGAQTATGAATHTFSDAFYTLHDFQLLSGTFAFGSNTIGMEGSFWNIGGAVSGTGTITMFIDGSGKNIRTNGQRLPSLVVNAITGSSDSVILREPIWTDALTLTDGTVDFTTTAPALAVFAGSVTSAGPVFSDLGAAEPFVLDGASGGTVTLTTAPNTVRVEDPTETNLVGYWKFDRIAGNTSPDHSGNGNTATLYNGARVVTTKPTLDIHNAFAIQCDGDTSVTASTADHVTLGTSNIPNSNQTQSVSFWVNLSNTTATQNFISLRADGNASTTGTDDGIQIGLVTGQKVRVWKPGPTTVLESTNTVSASTWYHITYTYDASEGATGTHRLYINDTLEDTETSVAPDTSALNQILLCAYDLHTSERMTGFVDEVRIYNTELSLTEVKALTAGRYAGYGGGSTFTLGGNSTIGGHLSIDSGTLATSASTLDVAGTTATTTEVDMGSLTVGSSTVTLNAGVTVLGTGTLTFASTGGVLRLGADTTLTMNGTLTSTTGTTATKPTIQSVSGTYNFHVGTATTATPTLNVNGLIVKNTKSDGLYVNQAQGATSTTITRFENVDFRSGTALGSHLKIYAQQGVFHLNNLTFDSDAASMTTAYAVHLTGNGGTTSATETRVMVAGTCTSAAAACESTYERDDDASEDGVGDTTASDGAVVQWIYRNWGDPAGTIEGFPTAAFDWSTFSFWRTYVAYNDVSGETDRVYVRDGNGKDLYSWDLPNSEDFVGTPRWTEESGSHYVYIASMGGRVYKLLDSGTTLDVVAGWPYKNGGDSSAATVTTPLLIDGAQIYWTGLNSDSATRIFRLGIDMGNPDSATPAAAVTAVPTISTGNIFFAGNGAVFRRTTAFASELAFTITNGVVSGRATPASGALLFIENNGTLWSISQSTMTENWHYQDTASSGHTCSNDSPCTSKNIFYDFGANRVYFGDKDGHVYAINASTGAAVSGYPMRPGADTDEITTAPLYRGGLILVGTSAGKVFVINASNAASSNNPTLYRTYVLSATAAVSSISFDGNTNTSGSPAGAYMVGTADGRLHYIPALSDPG